MLVCSPLWGKWHVPPHGACWGSPVQQDWRSPPGLGRGRADREGPGKDEGMGRRVDRPPTSFPRCCAERLSLRVYTFPQTEISRQTPGAESSEKPPAGCITRTPLVVKPSISPSGVRHLAARSWDHTWDQITSLSGPQQASSRECCPCTLEPRGGPEDWNWHCMTLGIT